MTYHADFMDWVIQTLVGKTHYLLNLLNCVSLSCLDRSVLVAVVHRAVVGRGAYHLSLPTTRH